MSFNLDNLRTLSRDQLAEIARQSGVRVHHKAKPETIIKQITDKVFLPPKVEQKHEAEKPMAPVFHHTQEDIEEALKDIKARIPDFISEYNVSENTVHFRCRGAEECLNLSIPMRVIKMKASNISRGRLVLRGHAPESFDRGNAVGKSSYTNVVLA